jgi:hypothetical protein
MQVSYFETARSQVPPTVPAEWPVPPKAYDPDGAQAYQGMIDRMHFVEELGFDWISVSEHHHSPRSATTESDAKLPKLSKQRNLAANQRN